MDNIQVFYDIALTPDEYREKLTELKDGFDKIYNEHTITKDSDFEDFKNSNMNLLVIAEPWCSHCMLNLAILFKLAEEADISVKVSLRDNNEELMNAYLTNGNKVIPKVIAIDNEGKEAAVWGPRAPMTAVIQKDIMKDMPEKGTEEYDAAFTAVKKEMKEKFMTSPELWDAVETDLKQTLSVK
ncbi:MAG: thioredoxin family protein [Jeotgalicoccus sp.]